MRTPKVAIVTGGGKGIGAAIVRHLLADNFRVIVAEINPLPKSLEKKNPLSLFYIKTNIASESSVKHMIQQAVAHFGKIDCLINNAGLVPVEGASFKITSLSTWNDYISTNLTGAFLCAKYAEPYLKKQKGTIVNIASTRALQSEGNHEPYAASKGGLVSLTHELAITLGPEIRVNCISPGWIHTKKSEKLKKSDHSQHPVGRVGKPQDIANCVNFLISEKASFITGQNIVVDGGMTIKMIYRD